MVCVNTTKKTIVKNKMVLKTKQPKTNKTCLKNNGFENETCIAKNNALQSRNNKNFVKTNGLL